MGLTLLSKCGSDSSRLCKFTNNGLPVPCFRLCVVEGPQPGEDLSLVTLVKVTMLEHAYPRLSGEGVGGGLSAMEAHWGTCCAVPFRSVCP